ncbi:MAG: hypothetical protein GY741_09820 [Phycisphaeraceae bacterium]|nr:hypothetical protein [Phycisphaeraceae bacterium]
MQVDSTTAHGGTGLMLRNAMDGRAAGTSVEFKAVDIDGWRLVRGDVAIGPEDRVDPMAFAAEGGTGPSA